LLDLIVRWLHLIAGIMWVGNSMLFNWLDRNLVRRAGTGVAGGTAGTGGTGGAAEAPKPAGPEAGDDASRHVGETSRHVGETSRHVGEIWMVHSGGFYQVEKKFLAPSQMPPILHWFKWQAYTTWMSGVALLVIVYYLGGGALLVDPGVSAITPEHATLVGLATVFGGLAIYDALWRSPIAKREALATFLSLALLAGAVGWVSTVLSGRAAYIHVGALLGTCMAGNVFLHIIPSQRELVAATIAGRDQDPSLSWRAKQRSIHNNYMTFPLLFLMLSNHFPSTFGNAHRALVLGVIMVMGATVRHVLNVRFTFPHWRPALGATLVAGIATLAFLLVPLGPSEAEKRAAAAASPPVSFASAHAIIQERCVHCHSATPKDPVFTTAPNGVIFDSPEQIHRYAERIVVRAVTSKTMPLANRTGMTDDERSVLFRWVAQGAKLEP
jgi:uncharacterized membrane protein